MRLSILLTVLVVVFLSIFNDATLARTTKNNVTSSITHHNNRHHHHNRHHRHHTHHHHHPTNTTVLPPKHTNHHHHHHLHTITSTSRDFPRYTITPHTSRTTVRPSSSTRRPRTTTKTRTSTTKTRTQTARPTTKSTSSSHSPPRFPPAAFHHSTATPTWGLVTPTPDTGSGSDNTGAGSDNTGSDSDDTGSDPDTTPTSTNILPDDGGGVLDPNGSVTSTPTPTSSTQDSLGGPTQSIIPGVSNGKFGLAVGLCVGGVAAIGLVGYAFHRRREVGKDENEEGPGMPQVQTRWRHQSFMARVGSVVAWLPADGRSSRSSQKSKGSRGSGTLPPVSPAVDSHSPIPSTGASQYDLSTAYGHDQMEEIYLR